MIGACPNIIAKTKPKKSKATRTRYKEVVKVVSKPAKKSRKLTPKQKVKKEKKRVIDRRAMLKYYWNVAHRCIICGKSSVRKLKLHKVGTIKEYAHANCAKRWRGMLKTNQRRYRRKK